MSVYLQSGIWWYEFYVDGKRFRSSTRTTDKAVAQRVEAEHRESLTASGTKVSATLDAIREEDRAARRAVIWEGIETQKLLPKSTKGRNRGSLDLTPKTLLRQAGDIWLNKQRMASRARTVESNVSHLRRLVEFFGNIPLADFTIAHFEHYQSARSVKCGASTVNHELNTLSRILRRADLWYPIKRNYSPLKDSEAKPPKIFTAIEQERIFRALKADPNLELGQIVFTITRNTTASGCELRGLRLSSLELDADPPRMHIPTDSTKNNIRPRTIPLNEAALNACKRALERAKKLGCHYSGDYLFPLRINRALWNPNKPASRSWLRKQTDYLREATGIDHINPHTFRHLAVTELLERGASEQTVIALAGWVGRKMIETYSHPRIEAKADAVELLSQSGHKAPERHKPSSPPQPPAPDFMHPAIQAEIARQVALALQRWNLGPPTAQQPAREPHLTTFPGIQSAQMNGGGTL